MEFRSHFNDIYLEIREIDKINYEEVSTRTKDYPWMINGRFTRRLVKMGCETSYLGTGICIGGFCICVGGKKSSSEKKPAEAKGKTEKLSLPETGKPAEKSVKKPSNDCFGKTSKAYLGVPYPSCEVMSPMETPLLHLPSLEIDSRLLLQTNPRLPKVILLDPAPFDPGKNPKSWSDYLLERYRPFYLR